MCGPGIIWKCRKRFSWDHPFCLTTETKRDGFFKENLIIVWITKMVRGLENAPCHVSCLPVVCVSGEAGVGSTAPWSSWQHISALPAHPSAGTAAPRPVCPPCWQCSWPLVHPKGFFYMWEMLGHWWSWPCPGPTSCCRVRNNLTLLPSPNNG